ncbi:MAG: winged helix-turn-helix domain-containing protein [Acidobacteria bacterium]|nr:winged helix-turn-helix domain-containing protein [Acidobacteriota bacterium]
MSTHAFSSFRLEERTGELRRGEERIGLPEQAFQVLLLLCRARGQPVSREDLQRRLWPGRRHGDFEGGLNSIVRKLRRALGDDGKAPALVETLPRRGYRLLVPVECDDITSIEGIEASLAVLPFANLSPDPENAYVADGLTEELISDLSRVRALGVISRTSAMHYKETSKRLPEIARELKVRYILEGSVRKGDGRLRVSVRLIDAPSERHLWAEKFDGPFEDIFRFQESISRRIVQALEVTLTPGEDRRLSVRPFRDIRALEAYLQAMQHIRTFTESGLDRALAFTDQALSLVGAHALLHATQGLIHWQYHNAGFKPLEETLLRAERSADEALALDALCHQALLGKGLVAWTRGDLGAARQTLSQAAAQQRSSEALAFLANTLGLLGRAGESRECADRALWMDPLNPWALWGRAHCELLAGDLAAAEERFRLGAALRPEDPLILGFQAVALIHAGRREAARENLEAFKATVPSYAAWADMHLGALSRDRGAVLAGVAALGPYARRDREMSWGCADCLAAVGEKKAALHWLGNTIHLGFVNVDFFERVDTLLAPLRRDPPFKVLMDRARRKRDEFLPIP